jgi:hypothetical protein
MSTEEQHVFEAQSPGNRVSHLTLRQRGEDQKSGTGISPRGRQELRDNKPFSRELILRLIDWIKDI